MHPDSKYIQALLDNDRPLLTELYRLFSPVVERFVRVNSGSTDDARDVMQEALVAIARQARRAEGFALTCPFRAYLLLVCKGKWLNELHRRKREDVTKLEIVGFQDEVQADALASETLLESARDALFTACFEKLQEGCRRLLQLSWSGDLGMEEVARQLGFTYAYARKRKCECVAALTTCVQGAAAFQHLK